MNENILEGKTWCFGDDIDTDLIIPARHLALPTPQEWAKHVMEPIDPDFASKLTGQDFIVAGENFGSGSSREHAAIALKVAGIRAVIAASFTTIFYRNAINNGLPVIDCAACAADCRTGDQLRVDLKNGVLQNLTQGKEYSFEPLPDFLLDMLLAGGLLSYYSSPNRVAP